MVHIVNGESGQPFRPEATGRQAAHDGTLQVALSPLLLQLLGNCIAQLQAANSIERGLQAAAAAVAQIFQLDRVLMVEYERDDGGVPQLRFAWNSAGSSSIAEWDALADFTHTELRAMTLLGAPEPQSRPLPQLRNRSAVGTSPVYVLSVPVMAEGVLWGVIYFEASAAASHWTRDECEFLRVLADAIGFVVKGHCAVRRLRQREALLKAAATVVKRIKPGLDMYQAIHDSLESFCKALNADRACVIEKWESPRMAQPTVLLRGSWQAPHIEIGFEYILRSVTPETVDAIIEWVAPLQRGEPVSSKSSAAPPVLREMFERVGRQSSLLVPIMVEGKWWGHVVFDDCHAERDWSETEIDAVSAFAEAMATAIVQQRVIDDLSKANAIVCNSSTVLYRLKGEPSFPMVYVSPNVSVFGYGVSELLESPTLYQSFVHAQDRLRVQVEMNELLRTGTDGTTVEYRLHRGDGQLLWVESRFRPVRDSNGFLVEVEVVTIDITERKLAEQQAILLSRTDALTGIGNRAAFNERLDQLFATAKRTNTPFAVLYLDLDYFKQVNDRHGHAVGDKLLKEVTQRLTGSVRETDFVARIGGDEFAILQTGLRGPTSCSTLADKLIKKISAPYVIDAHQLSIGTSVGIAVFSADSASGETMLVQADRALYCAKKGGRCGYRFHTPEMDATSGDSQQPASLSRHLDA